MSLRYILLDLHLFDQGTEEDKARSRKGLLWFLEALARWNQHYLRANPGTPKLYQSGVKYKLPEQFETGAVPEIGVIRAAVEKAGIRDRAVMKALEHLNERCGGGEHFRDIPSILENGGGDCFPAGTEIVRRDVDAIRPFTKIEDVRVGDVIWGRNRWSTVTAVAVKDDLVLDRITISDVRQGLRQSVANEPHNKCQFSLTSGHKIFVVADDGSVRRIKVSELDVGMRVLRSRVWLAPTLGPYGWQAHNSFGVKPYEWFAFYDDVEVLGKVDSVERAVETQLCFDITTDDHYVYLINGDVVVSNCDNLAAYRVAELREAGIRARPYITWRKRSDGGVTYHALVLWPDGSSEDPSLLLGMGGADKAKERAEEVRKNKERQDTAGKKILSALVKEPRAVVDDFAVLDENNVDWGDV